jgi:hypothetical protein
MSEFCSNTSFVGLFPPQRVTSLELEVSTILYHPFFNYGLFNCNLVAGPLSIPFSRTTELLSEAFQLASIDGCATAGINDFIALRLRHRLHG